MAYPDFNTWHQCKNEDVILAWSKAREVRRAGPLAKPLGQDIVEMPTLP